jgi:hypothetical protein
MTAEEAHTGFEHACKWDCFPLRGGTQVGTMRAQLAVTTSALSVDAAANVLGADPTMSVAGRRARQG